MTLFKRNSKIDPRTKEPLLFCPRCKVYMEKKHQKDVTIDVCPRCHGLWLDDHEIDKLLSHGEKQKKRRENARKGGGSS